MEAHAGELSAASQAPGQIIALATVGAADYEGKGMDAVQDGMKITHAELDTSIDALEASVDEQRELLAVFESTRHQIAEKS